MKATSQIIKYAINGAANTITHWLVFFSLIHVLEYKQATANVISFFVAFNLSYLLNSKFTFKKSLSPTKILIYFIIMAAVSFSIGWTGDKLALPPILTQIASTITSFTIGFLISKFLIFRN